MAVEESRLPLIITHMASSCNWLCHLHDVYRKYEDHLKSITVQEQMFNRLCELNVIEQVNHIVQTTIVQDAWHRKQPLWVHGWIYSLTDGLLKDLLVSRNAGNSCDTHFS